MKRLMSLADKAAPLSLALALVVAGTGAAFAIRHQNDGDNAVKGAQIAEIGTEKQTYHEINIKRGSTTAPGLSARQEAHTRAEVRTGSSGGSMTSTTRQREMSRQMTPQTPAEEAQQETAR